MDTSTGWSIGPVLGAVADVEEVAVGVVVVGVVEAAAAGMVS